MSNKTVRELRHLQEKAKSKTEPTDYDRRLDAAGMQVFELFKRSSGNLCVVVQHMKTTGAPQRLGFESIEAYARERWKLENITELLAAGARAWKAYETDCQAVIDGLVSGAEIDSLPSIPDQSTLYFLNRILNRIEKDATKKGSEVPASAKRLVKRSKEGTLKSKRLKAIDQRLRKPAKKKEPAMLAPEQKPAPYKPRALSALDSSSDHSRAGGAGTKVMLPRLVAGLVDFLGSFEVGTIDRAELEVAWDELQRAFAPHLSALATAGKNGLGHKAVG
jgi:hypothetical protein